MQTNQFLPPGSVVNIRLKKRQNLKAMIVGKFDYLEYLTDEDPVTRKKMMCDEDIKITIKKVTVTYHEVNTTQGLKFFKDHVRADEPEPIVLMR